MSETDLATENWEVRVRGTVQGVGFRPTVFRYATELNLHGAVRNDTDGVLIHLAGSQSGIHSFLQRLRNSPPPLAKIDAIESTRINSELQWQDFSISHSNKTRGSTEVAADAATCAACLKEVMTPGEHRYAYPFTNCTHCGPRLSIIEGIPYDRCNTTMRDFPLCQVCKSEYEDPLDRRFHAQPVACHDCGPGLSLHSNDGLYTDLNPEQSAQQQTLEILQRVNKALLAGRIVAIKGLGGFHLCCDATNHKAVSLLRQRKQRYAKPFALMTPDIATIAAYCELCDAEQEALQSPSAPIVLLQQKQNPRATLPVLSDAIAPGSNLYGFMLPYTPLHHMICNKFGSPLVMTSGNLSGEPQIIDNEEAISSLPDIADLILLHNRNIANRIDDSVVRFVSGRSRMMRRARGYAPRSICLPPGFGLADSILAYGAELKSTFCLIQHGMAILSQHQGDLEDLSTFDDYEHNLALYQKLFDFTPKLLAFDKHPEYLSSKLARQDKIDLQLPGVEVQHHHAHIASVMVENNLPLDHAPILGIALDGLGFGADGTLWGGEFLLADYCQFRRLGSLTPVAMPGGSMAIKQPWRNTYAHILNSMSWQDFSQCYGDTELARFLNTMPLSTVDTMLSKQLNCPAVSSAGRLFDAVAGALGICSESVQFEGQAAIELEMLAQPEQIATQQLFEPYPFLIEKTSKAMPINKPENGFQRDSFLTLNPAGIWRPLLDDIANNVAPEIISSRFHGGLVNALMDVITALQNHNDFEAVALSGGCLQNAVLLQGLEAGIAAKGLKVISHSIVPANDGGIALGQGAIAAARDIKGAGEKGQAVGAKFN